ncbi:DUF6414 family protein [Actinoplanes xinjiangensis]|uniref:DUF6414 family protein n=1 Tax=Actinoplanes xinjiangensis TaxID=512350 RepID=UPI003427ECC6
MTDRMLKSFIYLNEAALADYVSGLEGGLRGPVSRRSMTTGSADGGVDMKVAKAGVARNKESEESSTITDTPQARFNRFLGLVNQDPEAVGWLEVMDPGVDLPKANVGITINVECEIYVPDAVNAIEQIGELSKMLDTMDSLLPYANVFGLDTTGLPTEAEREAVKGFTALQDLTGGKTVMVGDLDDTNWRIAGQVLPQHLRGEIDGRATVVGKITAAWPKGKWKPMLALPGTSLIPREQRRQMERQGPGPGEEQNFLEGPAVMLDVLAIYR